MYLLQICKAPIAQSLTRKEEVSFVYEPWERSENQFGIPK